VETVFLFLLRNGLYTRTRAPDLDTSDYSSPPLRDFFFFKTSFTYKIRKYKGRKAFFAYRSTKRHLEGIKERLRGFHGNIHWFLKALEQIINATQWSRTFNLELAVVVTVRGADLFFTLKRLVWTLETKAWFKIRNIKSSYCVKTVTVMRKYRPGLYNTVHSSTTQKYL